MVRVGSLFGQMLELFDRGEFERAVRRHDAERYAKGFSCWDQFVAMLFCQVGQAKSLREICGGLATCMGKLRHFGMLKAPKRSTLAYANEHRPWELYQTVFQGLLLRCQGAARGRRKWRFRHKLYSFDSTTIDLCLSVFDWAKYVPTKGAIKLHMLFEHEGYLPSFGVITDGRVNDVRMIRGVQLPKDSMLVIDRGYLDYWQYAAWTEQGVWFVTRARANMEYGVVEKREVPRTGNILADEVIRLTSEHAQPRCQHLLRRVECRDPETGEVLVFLTNNMRLAGSTVAAVYKERWQIELFFRALKQNLRVRTFVGTSPNAVKTQIWTALVGILLLKYLQLRSRISWSLSNLVAFLRLNLLTYRDLWLWLNDPFGTPPLEVGPRQLLLGLAGLGQHP